jgi:acyl-CoA thioester hydrolase
MLLLLKDYFTIQIIPMNKHKTKLRVRYSETDKMGVVYHGNYIQYFEVGRVEYMRSIGVVYAELEKQGIGMPVVNINIDFIKPAPYDQELCIETWIESLPTSKIIFHNEASDEYGKLVCKAQVTLVFINSQFRPIKVPESVFNALKSNGIE